MHRGKMNSIIKAITMNKHLLIITLLALGGLLQAQENCFDYNAAIKQKEGLHSMDSMFAADRIFLAGMKGCAFPGEELFNLEGGKFNIGQLKGDLVFVSFWFASCHPCVEEAPEIVRLSQKYAGKKVKFLNITFEQKKTLLDFLTEHKMPGVIQTYQDREVLEKKFCAVFGFPMCMLLDKNGKVIEAWSGGFPADEFYKKVNTLISNNL
jgi:thiol-disulfide isomerase/thioredoxin